MLNSKYVKQAGSLGPFLQVPPCYAMTYGMKRHFGQIYFSKMYLFYSNYYGACYYKKDETAKVADYYISRLLAEDDFSQKEYRNWLKGLEKMESICTQLLAGQANEKLFENFYNLFIELWSKSFFVEAWDEDNNKTILECASKHEVELSAEEIIILTKPNYISIPVLMERDLLQALKKDQAAVEEVRKKYFYLDTGYLYAKDFDIQTRINEIKDLSEETDKINAILAQADRDQKRKEKLLEEKNIPARLQKILDFYALAAQWRDLRKKMHQIGAYSIWQYLTRQILVDDDLKPYLDVQDYFSKQHLEPGFQELLEKRKNNSLVILQSDGGIDWILQKDKIDEIISELQGEIKDVNEIKGMVANKGVARGKVKIIDRMADFDKLSDGDILVASMTRPEYLPIMKKAGAIVTDEGGLTCHAAIVSRELGKPCIIGTKIATRVLKDEDEVEVDAINGVVRII